MRSTNIIILLIAILIINAGISLVLINQFMGNGTLFKNDGTPVSKTSSAMRSTDITKAVAKAEQAVVSINVIKTETVRGGNGFGFPFFGFFDFPMQRQVQSFGSGVIYDAKNGYIITNSHVVNGATQTKVVLPDKREFDAEIVGIDDAHDIAKLRIKGSNLPSAALGSSSGLLIGEWAIAIGNPYGYLMGDSNPTVSVGVISAINRSFSMRDDKRDYKNMIQTDAAINPGNSGGPLIDINGEVIGINTFIFSENGGNVGIGFAIPIEAVKRVLATL
ncbi:MAG TPA: trypsin-like peptidase domain-containing protein [Candidatus Cloacimonadota bacterium]|nr:trypsin-like peptidase domain-containing protein [Candidatus Cloacimonadota bacterium]HPS38226.1 trypsin-like peptidase domain-containing protein [Candidatus Cloacimonadota bacterium]